MMCRTENILGYNVLCSKLDDLLFELVESLDAGARSKFIACVNPHSVEIAKRDKNFEKALKNAHLLLPDGAGIVLASRLLGGKIHKRITGSDLFIGLSRVLNQQGAKGYFFLGATNNTLMKIRDRMSDDFPNIAWKGAYSPPFKPFFNDIDDTKMITAINRAQPHVLWVGMTAPKQEKWIAKNRHRLHVPVVAAVGAVFDFYAGTVNRSNPAFQRVGLEWLPRLLQDPRRLWKRMAVSAPLFIFRVFLECIRK